MPEFLAIVYVMDVELFLLIADICDVANKPLLLRGPINFHSVTDLVWKYPLGIGGRVGCGGRRGVGGGGGGRRGVGGGGGGGGRGVGGGGRRGVGGGGQKFLVQGRVQSVFFAIGPLQAYMFHTYTQGKVEIYAQTNTHANWTSITAHAKSDINPTTAHTFQNKDGLRLGHFQALGNSAWKCICTVSAQLRGWPHTQVRSLCEFGFN